MNLSTSITEKAALIVFLRTLRRQFLILIQSLCHLDGNGKMKRE